MYNVSREFKKAIYGGVRRTYAKVRFEILDITAFIDNTTIVSGEAIISRKGQLTNKTRDMTRKYGVYEKDYLQLDGTFTIPPIPSELVTEELGWWSALLSGENGLFGISPTLEIDFVTEHSSAGLTIAFDTLNNEYASDFDIQVFDINGIAIIESSIVDNIEPTYTYLGQLSNYTKIVLSIKKWCKGFRRAKIVEVDFGVFKEYTEDNLVGLKVLQELDTTSVTLPTGTLSFEILNKDKEFDMVNPDGIYKYLKQGQECFSEFGVGLPNGTIEFVPMGKHYLNEWKTTSNNSIASFRASDIISLLTNTESEGLVERNITLYDLAVEVLELMNISNYELSSNLSLIYTKGLYKKTSLKEVLHMIAIAGMCIVFSDNMGTLHLKQLVSASELDGNVVAPEAIISNKSQVINDVLDTSFNIASYEKNRIKLDGSFVIPQQDMTEYEVGWWSDTLSDSGGVFVVPPVLEINLAKESSSINLEVVFDTVNGEYAPEIEILGYNSIAELVIDETILNTGVNWIYTNNLLNTCTKIQFSIKSWSKPYRRARVVEVGYDIPISNITHNTMYNEPDISIIKAVKTVEALYYIVDLNTNSSHTSVDTSIPEGLILKVDNTLINTQVDALNVAEWLLRENSTGATFKTKWMQNPALELADKVTLETRTDTISTVTITKQEFEYQGALRGTTEARGVI